MSDVEVLRSALKALRIDANRLCDQTMNTTTRDSIALERIGGTERSYDVIRERANGSRVWQGRVVLDDPIRVTRGDISDGLFKHIEENREWILMTKEYSYNGVL